MLKIDIHTHILAENLNTIINQFSDPRYLRIKSNNSNSAVLFKDNKKFRTVNCNCWDHHLRIRDCSKTDVDIQVLSTLPALFSYWANDIECLLLSEFLNNHIHSVINEYPQDFIGLGTIPMQNTDLAIKEMDRCINNLNFPGIQIGSNINQKNLSNKEFHPIFEHAEKINCSIFIHPWEMLGQNNMKKYWLPWLVGMPAETSRAVASIILGGILEKFPNLKIAFAHGGGSFPFNIGRIDHGFNVRPDLCATDNTILPSNYLKNFYVDSLVHDEETLSFLINKIGYNRIALGSDYPFPLGEKKPGELIEKLDVKKYIKERIFAGTAIEWLGLEKDDIKKK
ncbi:MAG: 2-amino-3-carboxymuconate-6-semialdehyde decarboxylase [Euryarchaeota archaeon]|nr:2-amino-3-carboxymuconate-6-semialdehyde decarboxylase [Euryarchaeota archaeon]